MTNGNFGFILSKYLASPGDPFYGWISKVGGWEKRRQIMSMFLFIACYFSQFVFAMSLFGQAFGSRAPVFVWLGVGKKLWGADICASNPTARVVFVVKQF